MKKVILIATAFILSSGLIFAQNPQKQEKTTTPAKTEKKAENKEIKSEKKVETKEVKTTKVTTPKASKTEKKEEPKTK